MFRSLRVVNYRIWFVGAVVSNTGAWMQRTAQDWIVLTELTDQDAAALGITMALQFAPMLLLVPVAGLLADRFERRKVLLWTQAAQGALALGLGILVVTDTAELWHVYAFALALGVATALDAPSRQAFVSELVPDEHLSNAVALNSTSFQTARLIGPAVAGVLIALVGSGPVFLINAASFAGVLGSLLLIRRSQLRPVVRPKSGKGQMRAGVRYVRARPDILVVLAMVFLIGTFGFNFPVFISTMSTVEFGLGSSEYGLLSSVLAIGSLAGSLLAARRERARFRIAVVAAALFGAACLLAAITPTVFTFGLALVLVGVFSLTMMTTANAYVQTTTSPAMRGRVMALYMAIFVGGTPIGAPVVGWVANTLGPRWAMVFAAGSGLVAAAVALVWLVSRRGMRITRGDTRFSMRVKLAGSSRLAGYDRELATQEIGIVESTTRRTS